MGDGDPIARRLAGILPGAVRFLSEAAGATLGELSGLLNAPVGRPSEVLIRAAGRLAARNRATDPASGEASGAASGAASGPVLGATAGPCPGLPDAGLPDPVLPDLSRPVLAANHHGFDTHPEMVQGTLIMGLAAVLGPGPAARPLTVLASSAVPLNNPTAPGGLLPGRRGPGWRRTAARLFPRSLDHVMVSRAPALSRDAVTALPGRLRALPGWTGSERRSAGRLVERFLLDPAFLGRGRFVDQASWLASAVWADRLAPGPGTAPVPLIHLDLEALVAACLAADLADPASPAHRALFHAPTRRRLTEALSGGRGAWSADLLGPGGPSASSRGTAFFWAVDPGGVRRPMALRTGAGPGGGRAALGGGGVEIPLAPEPLATALAEGLVAPGLLMDYLVLGSHGLAARGGVFMADYLPALLGPAGRILDVTLVRGGWGSGEKGTGEGGSGGSGSGGAGSGWPAGPLLGAGLIPIGLEAAGSPGGWAAAGALELMGPLGEGFFGTLAGVRVSGLRDFTLGEWYQEETPPELRESGWEGRLGAPAVRVDSGG